MCENTKRQVPILVSLSTYLVMFVGSVFATFVPFGLTGPSLNLSQILAMTPFFALGFWGFCDSSSGTLSTVLLIVVNAIFLAFFVFFIRARSWSTFGALCCGFAVILMLNFAGWNVMVAGFPDIASSDER